MQIAGKIQMALHGLMIGIIGSIGMTTLHSHGNAICAKKITDAFCPAYYHRGLWIGSEIDKNFLIFLRNLAGLSVFGFTLPA